MKSILAVLLLCLFSNLAFSQNTVNRIGSTVGNDEGRKSVIDDSDNVYVCGYFANTCNFSSSYSKTSAGGTDIYLAKYNCQGVLQWVQTIGGSNNDNTAFHFLGLDIDNQNNVLLSGSINASGNISSQNGSNISITTAGNSDAIVVKYSNDGNIIWHKKYGGTGTDDASLVRVNKATNDVIISGFYNSSSLTIGSTSLTNAGNDDVFICKLNSAGVEQWAVKFGGVGNETSNHCMSVDNNGNIYIGSNTDNTLTLGSLTMTHMGVWGGFFLKYNTNGVLQWVVRTSNTGTSGGQGISNDNLGNAYLVSMFTNTVTYTDFGGNTVTYTSTNSGLNDIAIMKINPSGNIVWSKRSTGNNQIYGLTICLDGFKNIYVSGAHLGIINFNGATKTSTGNYDAYILKTDSNGNNAIIKSYGGSTSIDFANHINVSSKNKISVVGDFTNTASFGSLSLTPYGAQDAFLLIDRNDSSYVFLPNDTIICGDSFTITPNTSSSNYLWNTSATTQTLTVNSTGWYKLRIQKNCNYYYDSIYISMDCGKTCYPCSATGLPINQGLVACYPFNGNTNDESNNGNNGTNFGASLTTDRFGTSNSAYNFNGTTNYIAIPYNSMLNFTPTGQFTLSAWVSPASGMAGFGGVILKSTNTGLWDYGLYLTNSYKGMTGYSSNNLLTTNTTFPQNQWYLLTATYNNGDWKIYVNCQLDNSFINSGLKITQSIGGLAIGRKGDSSNDYYKGKIDDVKIYNRILSLSEIQDLFNCSNYLSITTNNDTTVCLGSSKLLTTSGNATKYMWSTGDTTSSITVTPSATNTYWVRGQLGTTACYTYDTITITVTNCATCFNCAISDTINNNLLVCYPYNNNAIDQSGNGNHGTPTSISYPNDRVGKVNSAASFNGSSSLVTFSPTNLQLDTYSYCAWVRISTLPTNGNAICILDIGGSTNDQGILVGNNYGALNGWIINSYGTNSLSYAASSGTLPNINTWYFVCQTRNNNIVRLYVNGVLVASKVIPNINAGYSGGTIEALIGARTNSSNRQYFNGLIDDVRIYNKILSPLEISRLFHSLELPIAGAGTDQTICIGDSVQLSASGGSSYTWNPDSTLSDTSISNPWAKPTSSKTYYVKVSNGSCYDLDTIEVIVNPLPTIQSNNDTSICMGSTIQLTSNGSANRYLWSTGDTTSTINILIIKDSTIWVSGQIGNTNCFAFDTVRITAIPLPVIITDTNYSVCLNSNLILSITGTSNRYLWSTGDTTSSINFLVNNDTTLWIRGQIGNNPCFAYDTIKLYVVNPPIINTINDTSVCENSTILLSTSGTANSYLWSTGDTTASINMAITKDTLIWVRGASSASSNCYAYDSVLITMLPGPIINTNNDSTVCIGSNILLNTFGNANRFLWSNGDTTSTLNIIVNSDTTIWVRGQIGTGACYSYDTVKIIAAPFPMINSFNDTTICAGTTIVRTVTGTANRFVWSSGDTTATLSITTNKDSVFWVRGQIGNNACYTYDTFEVKVIPYQPLNIGNDTIICNNSTIQLHALAGVPRVWSNNDTNQTITVTAIADSITFIPQKYWVRSGFGNCLSYDTILIYSIVRPKISPALNGQTTICIGGSVSLSITNVPWWAKIKWNTGDTSRTVTFNPSSTTTYYVSYLNNECGFVDSIVVNVIPKPLINVSADDTICIGDPAILTVRGANSYVWNTTATDSDLIVTPLVTTTYWVIGNSGTCLSDTQRVTITVIPKPNALFTVNPAKGSAPLSVQFTNQSSFTSNCLWIFGDGETDTTFSPNHIYKLKGNFSATLIAFNAAGCSDTFSMDIIVLDQYILLIPSVFSPNNDGLNDLFEIYAEGILSLDGEVYNRWGEKLHEWHTPNAQWWDGTYKDKMLPAGVYIYIINVKDNTNKRHVFKGPLTLIR